MPTTFETVTSWAPLLAMLSSLGAVPLILASGRWPNLREAWTLLAACAQFVAALMLLGWIQKGIIAECVLWELAPGIEFALKADPFAVYFSLIASSLWILTSIYSIGYMRGNGEREQTRYFASFALSLFSTLGVAFSANLLTFIVFYELLTLGTYPLVAHKETPEAIRSARQYLAYSLTAGLLLIAGTIWVYSIAGTIDFTSGGVLDNAAFSEGDIKLLFCLFLAGVGVKAGLMPLHSWLPNAMVAPTPVSALLHAVAVVKSGVFGLVRVVIFIFGPEPMREFGLSIILGTVAGSTIVLASLLALRQESLKRRLAYSTVGHLSYIALGLALLSTDGVLGGIFHISTHAMMKITLFFCAGAIYVHARKQNVSELNGIGRAMPWTMGAFTIGALGLTGLPPVNGFLSKWYLCVGSAQSGWWLALVIFLLSGLLNATYFFSIVRRAYFEPPSQGSEVQGEASWWMVGPLVVTAGLAVVLGIFPDLIFQFYSLAASIAETALPRGSF